MRIIEFPFSPNEIKWPWSPESASFGSVTGLDVQIFGNNEPLESGEYHLGQEIELSYTISNLPEDVVIEKQQWVISSPTPKSFFISDDKGRGEVVPLPEEDLENQTIKFCLYDYFLSDEEDISFGRKTATLILTFGGKEHPYPFWIPYKKPYLKNVKILPPQQEVCVAKDSDDSKWKIGFQNKEILGIHAYSEIYNPTNKPYLITSTSLIRLNNKRWFSPTPLTDRIQFRKTIPNTATLNTKPELWLDTYLPGKDAPNVISKILFPNSHDPKAILADDIPLFLLELDEPGIPTGFQAEASFVVIFWVKPAPMDTSIWCPIRRMVWSWNGITHFDKEKLEWVDNSNNYSVDGLMNTSVEFPKWFGWAHPDLTYEDGSVDKENPSWREK